MRGLLLYNTLKRLFFAGFNWYLLSFKLQLINFVTALKLSPLYDTFISAI